MVFSGLYPIEGDDFPTCATPSTGCAQRRRPGLRARVVDRARVRVPLRLPRPAAHGHRRERLEREFDLALITTAPNVAYRVTLETGETIMVSNPSELPPAGSIQRIEEPYVAAMVLARPTTSGR